MMMVSLQDNNNNRAKFGWRAWKRLSISSSGELLSSGWDCFHEQTVKGCPPSKSKNSVNRVVEVTICTLNWLLACATAHALQFFFKGERTHNCNPLQTNLNISMYNYTDCGTTNLGHSITKTNCCLCTHLTIDMHFFCGAPPMLWWLGLANSQSKVVIRYTVCVCLMAFTVQYIYGTVHYHISMSTTQRHCIYLPHLLDHRESKNLLFCYVFVCFFSPTSVCV